MSWRAALPRAGISETSGRPAVDLAAALASAGERVAALEAYRELLLGSPDDDGLLRALSAVLDRLGRDEEGVAIRTRIAVLAVDRMGLAEHDRAAALVFELSLDGLGPVPASMPAGYVAALFDAYAPKFDDRLRDDLRYRAPELVASALASALARTDAPGTLNICDVGCGTGLLGPLLRVLARRLGLLGRLDGVDRSPRMLERASALHVYDELVVGDLAATLLSRPAAYDVVTAADVFGYIGDLEPAFTATATALRCGGIAAFTTEQGEASDEMTGGYRLMATGRYQHAAGFVRAMAKAARLREVSADAVILRVEQGQAVAGVVWVLKSAG